MFELFRKEKNPVKLAIGRDGLSRVAEHFAKEVMSKMDTSSTAYQFVLEELDAAAKGNEQAIAFAKMSGISPQDYNGAMGRSFAAVDGPGGPQQTLLSICIQLRDDVDQMVLLRTTIVDYIMQHFGFGKYADTRKPENNTSLIDLVSKTEQSEYGEFVCINNDLGNYVEHNKDLPNEVMMAYGYARRFAVAGMFAQGLVDMDLVSHVTNIFRSLQMSTGQTKEFQNQAAENALGFINSYFDGFSLTLNDIGLLCHAVEQGMVTQPDGDFFLPPKEIIFSFKNGRGN